MVEHEDDNLSQNASKVSFIYKKINLYVTFWYEVKKYATETIKLSLRSQNY